MSTIPFSRSRRSEPAVPGRSGGLYRVRLLPGAPLDYRPGQYVEIGLPGTAERRSYSMTGPPDPSGTLSFLVGVGHRRVLDALGATAGDPVTVLGPFGRLYHRPAERPILMAATGAGMGPLLAVLRALRAAGTAVPIRFWYGARP